MSQQSLNYWKTVTLKLTNIHIFPKSFADWLSYNKIEGGEEKNHVSGAD